MRRAGAKGNSEISDTVSIRKSPPSAQWFVDTPYEETNKMLSTRWAMRYKKNQAPSFHNVHEGRWYSVYRRALAIKMKATSNPVEEYVALPVEIKGDIVCIC